MTHAGGLWLAGISLGLGLMTAVPGVAQDTAGTSGPPPGRPNSVSDSGVVDSVRARPGAAAGDTAHFIHITIDSSRVDSLVLDTLRRAILTDSLRAVATRDSMENATTCEGRRITIIAVRPQPPYIGATGNRTLAWALRQAGRLHTTTRSSVIRRFLAFKAGDVCVERRRAESERLLRAQPFIQSAHISAYADGPTGVRLDVFTVDELSAEFGIGFEAQPPLVDQLRLGTGNLFGRAINIGGGWAHRRDYRDRVEGNFADFQTFGHPWVTDLSADLDHVGGGIQGSLSHPYFTDLQVVGWRVTAGSSHNYIQFREPNARYYPTLDLERAYANAGALLRLGSPAAVASDEDGGKKHNRLALVGLAVSHESDGIGGGPVLLTRNGLVGDTTAATARAFAGRFAYENVDRVNALFGLRAVQYLTVRGFDALVGEQDIPRGAQLSAVVGRGLSWFGSARRDVFLAGRLDAAAGTSSSIVRGGVETELRREDGSARWEGLITSGRVSWYLKPSLPRTLIFSTDLAFGARETVPFQLALGDPQGGVRGYLGSGVAGAVRTVGRTEYRTLFRPPFRLLRTAASWAVAGFVDAGKVWAGDVPFGTTSPIVAGAGIGLLLGVPAASRQIWRIDVAAPLVHQPRARWEFRISSSNSTRVWWTEAPDVTRSREQTVTPSLFSYP